MTLFGVVLMQMFLVGFLAARAIPGERSEFIMELPPLRLPQLGNIVRKTLLRVRWYLGEAVPLFLIGTALLFVLEPDRRCSTMLTDAAGARRGRRCSGCRETPPRSSSWGSCAATTARPGCSRCRRRASWTACRRSWR